MKRHFMAVGLWLLGTVGSIAPAQAFDVATGEALHYRVFWGPFQVGTADLNYVPQGVAFGKVGGYVVQARVRSDTSLMTMDDLWRAVGTHAKASFTPQRYEVAQIENDYTASKQMVFVGKKVSYINNKDAYDKADALVWDKRTRDPLGTVYAWRKDGLETLKQGADVKVVGLKKTFALERKAAVKDKLTLRGKAVPVWRVDMISTAARQGKEPRRSKWTVWLSDDGALTPLQILAQTKFGTFRAQLAN